MEGNKQSTPNMEEVCNVIQSQDLQSPIVAQEYVDKTKAATQAILNSEKAASANGQPITSKSDSQDGEQTNNAQSEGVDEDVKIIDKESESSSDQQTPPDSGTDNASDGSLVNATIPSDTKQALEPGYICSITDRPTLPYICTEHWSWAGIEQRHRTYTFKVIVVGNVAVGKTAIVRRYVDEQFQDNYATTIGVDYFHKIVQHEHGSVFLRIHDIAGQDRTFFLSRAFYREAEGVIVCYNVTDQSSLESVTTWTKTIKETFHRENGTEVPLILFGNKADVSRRVDDKHRERMKRFAEDNGFIAWYEVSAKTGEFVEEAVELLIHMMVVQCDEENRKGVDARIKAAFVLAKTQKPKSKCSFTKCS